MNQHLEKLVFHRRLVTAGLVWQFGANPGFGDGS
jgi:hypothetical protein